MKSKLILFSIFLVVSQISVSQNFKFGKVSKEELQEKSHPTEPDASAAILYREFKTNFEYLESEGFVVVTEVFERIKIYKKEGFEWGTRSVSLYQGGSGAKEEITSLKAYTYYMSAEGKIEDEKLRSDGVFDEKTSKYRVLKKFTMPNLKVGCVIEFRYTMRSPFISNINTYDFQETIPVNLVDLNFATPEYLNYKTHQKGWLPIKMSKDNRDRSIDYTYLQSGAVSGRGGADKSVSATMTFRENISKVKMESVPSITEELYAGNINNYTSSLKFELAYTKFPNAAYNSYSRTWEDVSETIFKSSSFGGEIKKTNYFKKEIDPLIDGISSPKEKMMRIFEFAKSKMVWNSIYGISTDEGVKDTYKNGSGNVADINLSLTGMFRYAGLNANPVLVSTKKNGIPIFPTRNGFNYVISGVVIDGAVYLCDATNKSGEVNILEDRLLNWKGRMILDEKTSAWVPLVPKKHAVQNTMLNVEITDELTVKGISKNRSTGHYAMELRDVYEGLNVDAKRKRLERDMRGTELNNVVFENLEVLHKPITYSFDFNASAALESVGGKLYFSPLWYLTTIENPFKLNERKYPVDYGYIRKDRYLISINIPEGYTVESMPENTNFGLEQGMGSYKYIISNSGDKIQITVELALNEAVIPAENYGGLKKFFELLIAKENEKVVLSKI
jgi:hypothetical protein